MSGNTIITRIWHGRTRVQDSDQYLNYVTETGLKDYMRTPGILSAKVLRRIDGEICHFWTITEWPDIDCIKLFAGTDYEKAKYYPEDKDYLLELEEKVIHCETFTTGKPAL